MGIIQHAHADVLVHLLRRLGLEGSLSADELAKKYAQLPDVDAVVMPHARENFRRHINRRAALGLRPLALLELLGKAKVDQLDVALAFEGDHDVFRLEVAVNDAVRVEVLEGHD